MPDEPDTLLTPHEAARYLKVSPSWVYDRTRTGTIPCYRVGRYQRLPQKELTLWARLGCPPDWREALASYARGELS